MEKSTNRFTFSQARALLSRRFAISERDVLFLQALPAGSATATVTFGDVQVCFCDYRGIPGYDPVIAVAVYLGKHGHLVLRFNIVTEEARP